MEPTISVREVITVDPQRTPTVGEVVTFFREGQLITHRVTHTWFGTDPSGRVRQMFTTHGDANEKADPWTVLDDDILGTVVPTSPLVVLASWLSMRPVL
jgi:signal peptidase I